jgi:hypothetical protein
VGLKAYPLDLRERVVKFVAGGGPRAEAARLFRLGERPVYRYLAAAKANTLAPRPVGAIGASSIRPNFRRTSATTPTPRSRNCNVISCLPEPVQTTCSNSRPSSAGQGFAGFLRLLNK